MGTFRETTLPLLTTLLSLPLLFSFQLKNPPPLLKGYAFVFAWSWGAIGALLVPVLLVIECVVIGSMAFGRTQVDRPSLGKHAIAVSVAVAGLLILWAARTRG